MNESLKCSLAENQVNLMPVRRSNMSELVVGYKPGRSHWKCYKCLRIVRTDKFNEHRCVRENYVERVEPFEVVQCPQC